jgi:hypothetical protein
MREGLIQSWCVKQAKKQGFWARKFKAAGRRSAPDYVFAKPGIPAFFVEFKATGEDATDQQKEEHRQMREAGMSVYVCDAREKFQYILDLETPF